MPRMSSNLENTKAFAPIERDWYNGRVRACASTTAKITKNPMLQFDWDIVDHPRYNNRQVNFDNVMIGGRTKEGKDMPLNNLLNYIDALKVPYDCKACGQTVTGIKKQREDYLCGNCNAPLVAIEYNTEDFVGKIAKIYVDISNVQRKDENGELKDTGEQRNEIKQVKAL